jgi:DNA-binding Lrp family transcriptional regulator
MWTIAECLNSIEGGTDGETGPAQTSVPFLPEGKNMRAYILVNVRPGKVREIVAAVSQMEGVRHADACWGLPDVFVYVETPSEKRLNELVIDQIQKLEGVERTETHIAVE